MAINSYQSLTPTTSITSSPSLSTYKAGQLGYMQPLVSDLLTQNAAPNSYMAATMQGDAEKIKNRLAEYNSYDASKMGGLADYFAQNAASRNKNELYMRPAEFKALQDKLSGVSAEALGQMTPMLSGLNAVGALDGNTYYDRTKLTDQLNKYSVADLSPYQNFDSVKGLNPIATVGANKFYNKSDLESLAQAKNYWGDVNADFAAILGSAYGQDERGKYIKGLIDPTKFQSGDTSYGKQDIGGGKYNILGSNGSVLGTGYYDIGTAADKIIRENAIRGLVPTERWVAAELPASAITNSTPSFLPGRRNRPPAQVTPLPEGYRQAQGSSEGTDENGNTVETQPTYEKLVKGYDVSSYVQPKYRNLAARLANQPSNQTFYSDYDQAKQVLMSNINNPGYGVGGGLSGWEVLGQALNGAGNYSGLQQWGGLPLNGVTESVKGANTLYGSTPVFYDNKLIGYKADFGTGAPTYDIYGSDSAHSNPFGYQAAHKGKNHSWATSIGRDIDPNAYAGLVQGLGGTNYFAPVGNVDKLPGWNNVESYQRRETPQGIIQTVWEATSPTHNLLGMKWKDAAPIGQAVGDIVGMYFGGIPIGSLLMSADGYSKGDEKSGNRALGSAALSYAGGQIGAGDGSSVFGTGVDLGSTLANQAAQSAIMGAASTGIQGGNLKDILMSAAMGGLSSAGGNYLGDAMKGYSPLAQAAGKAGLRTGLGALRAGLTGGNVGKAGLSGGLGSLLASGLGSVGKGTGYSQAMTVANPVIQQLLRQQIYKK